MGKSDVFQGSVAVAEDARDKASYTGFLAGLFETDVRWDLLTSIGIPESSTAALDFIEQFKAVILPPESRTS
jgi:hypothetical protein